MRSSSTAAFRKLKTCPTAETLLLHSRSDLAREQSAEVTRHLSACDFCAAEAQMLSSHEQVEAVPHLEPCEMPASLLRLALGLLSPNADRALFAELTREAGRLTLTDA